MKRRINSPGDFLSGSAWIHPVVRMTLAQQDPPPSPSPSPDGECQSLETEGDVRVEAQSCRQMATDVKTEAGRDEGAEPGHEDRKRNVREPTSAKNQRVTQPLPPRPAAVLSVVNRKPIPRRRVLAHSFSCRG